MPAQIPEEICHLFKQYMADGDIESLRNLYDPEVVFVNQSGELRKGWEGLKNELVPFASARAKFEFRSIEIVQSGDLALMHTEWTV
jgi:ketosteroid isomerase-like protein